MIGQCCWLSDPIGSPQIQRFEGLLCSYTAGSPEEVMRCLSKRLPVIWADAFMPSGMGRRFNLPFGFATDQGPRLLPGTLIGGKASNFVRASVSLATPGTANRFTSLAVGPQGDVVAIVGGRAGYGAAVRNCPDQPACPDSQGDVSSVADAAGSALDGRAVHEDGYGGT